ncbi:RNA-binding S4 domain-containing protein [Aquicoccus sp. SCR17]|nr:RNA-binding S4 domain-containing protein [Carideicomes alvinocaridis]
MWQARFVKTRSLASKLVTGGHVRVNSEKVAKPAHPVVAGDVLTFPQGTLIRVVRVVAMGERRGPASEAQGLYEDLNPPSEQIEARREARAAQAPRFEGKGRPTKRDRRKMDRERREAGEAEDVPPARDDEDDAPL